MPFIPKNPNTHHYIGGVGILLTTLVMVVSFALLDPGNGKGSTSGVEEREVPYEGYEKVRAYHVCPSASSRTHSLADWGDLYREKGCTVPTIWAFDACSEGPPPGVIQVRACTDMYLDETFTHRCASKDGTKVGVVRGEGKGIAYVRVDKTWPGQVGHLLGHMLGFLHSPRVSNVMHEDLKGTDMTGVTCE